MKILYAAASLGLYIPASLAFTTVPLLSRPALSARPQQTTTLFAEDDAGAVAVVAMNKAAASGGKTTTTTRIRGRMDEGIFTFNKILIDSVYDLICFVYPVTGGKRDFARFFVLETVARVPYFAYLSVLHFRETFGERGTGETMRTHYAEADNELHHLLIMESLGGNDFVLDRWLAQTMAFFYYWYVVVIYAVSEQAAYHLSELIEDHAYETYDGYLKKYEDNLKSQPVPAIARKYYVEDNPFMFDQFCTVKEIGNGDNTFSARRPTLNTLYDVFVNVRDDEREHWKTLCNLVQYQDMQGCENSQVRSTEPKPKEGLLVSQD
jgi:ubiquinol oxidase